MKNNKDTCINKLILFMDVLNHVKALKHYIIVTLHGTDFFLLIKQHLVLVLSNIKF